MKWNSEKAFEMKRAYKKLFMESVNRGLADADAGRVHSAEEMRDVLQTRRQHRKR